MTSNPETKFLLLLSESHQTKNKPNQWDELSDLEEENMEDIKSEEEPPPHHTKHLKTKPNKLSKKASQV